MSSKRLILAVAAMGVFALVPATATANVLVSPANIDFPTTAVGTKSAGVPVTLTKNCAGAEDTQCFAGPEGPTFTPAISTSGMFSQTNNCPPALTATMTTNEVVSCTITVFFSPTATGPTFGSLNTGTGGPSVTLSGHGSAAPSAHGKQCKKAKKKKGKKSKRKKGCRK